jgi:hypothetical protein
MRKAGMQVKPFEWQELKRFPCVIDRVLNGFFRTY